MRARFYLTLFLLACPTYGEITAEGGGELAQQKMKEAMADPSQVKSDPKVDTQGREYKAKEAKNQGNAGKAALIAAGTAMTSAAVPMLASPIAAVRAAGAALMAAGIAELATGAAMKDSSDQNGDQEQKLTMDDGQGKAGGAGKRGQSQPTAGESSGGEKGKAAFSSPQLDQLLADRGVNSSDFVQRLASGELTDPADILRAAGDTTEITEQDLAEGRSLAQAEMTKILMQDRAIDSPAAAGSSSFPSLNATGVRSLSDEVLAEQAARESLSSPRGHNSAEVPIAGSSVTSGGSAQAIREALNLWPTAPTSTSQPYVLTREWYVKRGIQPPPFRSNLFLIARRNYRSFSAWRRSVRLASQ